MSKNTFVVLFSFLFVFLMLFIVACIVPSRGDVEIDLDGPTGFLHITSIDPTKGNAISNIQSISILFNRSIDPNSLTLGGSLENTSDGGVWLTTNNEGDTFFLSPQKEWTDGSQDITIFCKDIYGNSLPSVVKLNYDVSADYAGLTFLDVFNDTAEDPNAFGGDNGAWASTSPAASVGSSFVNIGGRDALQLDYDITNSGSYGGYYLKMAPSDAPYFGKGDLTSFAYLTFKVRGDGVTNPPLKIELKNASADTSRKQAKLYVTDYLDTVINTTWKEVKIPMDAFCNLDTTDDATELVFAFEEGYADTAGFDKTGTIYIDDVGFGNVFLDYVRIDHFGDKYALNALGANTGGWNANGADVTADIDVSEYNDYANGLKLEYDVSGGSSQYAGYYSIFGGGDTWDIGKPHNFSRYGKITLYLKSEAGTEPDNVKIELKDRASSPYPTAKIPDDTIEGTAISSTWTKYTLDLSSFSPSLDETIIQQFTVTLTYDDCGAGNRTGTLYFDEIQFEK